jgi:hypothetical protein
MFVECPLSVGIANWWSDGYGEGPRMFYHALSGVPDWAPPGEDHILYSKDVLKDVVYGSNRVQYFAVGKTGIETLRLTFKPSRITVNGKKISERKDVLAKGYTVKALATGGYTVKINRAAEGKVDISL